MRTTLCLVCATALAGCDGVITSATPTTPTTPVVPTDCTAAAVAEHAIVHRLTATEYDNTIKELFGVSSTAAISFPPQPAGPSGYTNDSTGLETTADFVDTLFTEAGNVAAAVVTSKGAAQGAYARLAACASGFAPNQLRTAPQQACMTSVIAALAPRAWRRPVTAEELAQLAATFAQSGDFDTGLNDVIEALLMSPHFLFVMVVSPQSTDPNAKFALTPHQLASRLSYFLWQSMPDAQLLAKADDGTLTQATVLQGEVGRMLADPRGTPLRRTLRDEYAQLGRLDAAPVQNLPEPLRAAMIAETDAFLADFFVNDRAVSDLVGARRSFANKTLADHYGLAFPSGKDPASIVTFEGGQTDRIGLGTQGSVLTATAGDINFTHPVKRGHFVAAKVLCAPPPAPPANVPPINPDPAVGGTPREKLAVHTANTACAGCHVVMDEVGLGLENYDQFGRWRTTYPGLSGTIDASGKLPNGQTFTDAKSMYQAIASLDSTSMCVAQQLMKLALQSPLATGNARCAQVQVASAASGGTVSSLVKSLVTSPTFLMQAGEAP